MSILGNSPSYGSFLSWSAGTTASFSTTPAVSSADFAGREFDPALGEVYGLRVWRIDEHGRLRARNITNAKPWRPGVNVAECKAAKPHGRSAPEISVPGLEEKTAISVEMQYGYQSGAPLYRVTWDDGSTTTHGTINVVAQTPDPEQPVPDERCGCGFYAYTESRHEETAGNKSLGHFVLGIIKGTGRTLIGSKGFRCEKAEIVALRDPTRGGRKTAAWRMDQLAKINRVYSGVPVLPSRVALLDEFPLSGETRLDPSTEEFWEL